MQKQYQAYTLKNFQKLPQIQRLSEEALFAMQVIAHVYPFRVNNYVVDELINWDDLANDPIFTLTFPRKEMLMPAHYEMMADVINDGTPAKIEEMAQRIRLQLNPHPAGQKSQNLPFLDGHQLGGMQHKYKETVLFFPSQGQICHAYCTFCFRWPQFVGDNELKFAMRDIELLIRYLRQHTEVSDVLFTGGDPLVMKTSKLAAYINALLEANISHLHSIRLGTKSLSYWPYRFVSDPDAEPLLELFRQVTQRGKHLALMAHFNHPQELKTEVVREAIARIRETGAEIRTQSALLNHINADSDIWVEMWKEQTKLGCIPYYMFIARDTGAQHYFEVPLVKASEIFKEAYQRVSGLSRTVRGPSMSATPGKVQVLGVSQINGEKVFVLQFLQGRNPQWVMQPFFAKYDSKATWLDDLRPAFGSKFFFE
jgi:KamA family protein